MGLKIKFHAILTSGVAFSRGHPASAASWVSRLWASSSPECAGGPGTTSQAAPATSHRSRAAGAHAANPEEPPPPPGRHPWHLLLWHLGPPLRDVVAPPAPGVPPRGVLPASPGRLQSTPRAGPQKAWTPPTPGQEPGLDPSIFADRPPCPLHVLLPLHLGPPSRFPANQGASQSWGASHSPGGQKPGVKGPARGSSGEPTCAAPS